MTTEKDFVRFPRLPYTDLPVLFLRVQIQILSGRSGLGPAGGPPVCRTKNSPAKHGLAPWPQCSAESFAGAFSVAEAGGTGLVSSLPDGPRLLARSNSALFDTQLVRSLREAWRLLVEGCRRRPLAAAADRGVCCWSLAFYYGGVRTFGPRSRAFSARMVVGVMEPKRPATSMGSSRLF